MAGLWSPVVRAMEPRWPGYVAPIAGFWSPIVRAPIPVRRANEKPCGGVVVTTTQKSTHYPEKPPHQWVMLGAEGGPRFFLADVDHEWACLSAGGKDGKDHRVTVRNVEGGVHHSG